MILFFFKVLSCLILTIHSAPVKKIGTIGKRLFSEKTDVCSDKKNSQNVDFIHLSGGCFWGLELAFQRLPGVLSTEVGYCGVCEECGVEVTYQRVLTGSTNLAETVKIKYNSDILKLSDLLDWFLMELHDPTTKNRQGNDVGTQYRSAIWPLNEEQYIQSKQAINRFSQQYKILATTEIGDIGKWKFYSAETYHQQYLEKHGQSARKSDLSDIRCYG